VYFIQGIDGGLIKIGSASNVNSRLKSLQAGSPVLLRVLGSVEGSLTGELGLHKRLAAYRAHGEWFVPHTEVHDVMAETLAGKIDLFINHETGLYRVDHSNPIRRDAGLVDAIGAEKIANHARLNVHDVREWVWTGVPKSHRRTVVDIYRAEGADIPPLALSTLLLGYA
jgi:hypothetical protein